MDFNRTTYEPDRTLSLFLCRFNDWLTAPILLYFAHHTFWPTMALIAYMRLLPNVLYLARGAFVVTSSCSSKRVLVFLVASPRARMYVANIHAGIILEFLIKSGNV